MDPSAEIGYAYSSLRADAKPCKLPHTRGVCLPPLAISASAESIRRWRELAQPSTSLRLRGESAWNCVKDRSSRKPDLCSARNPTTSRLIKAAHPSAGFPRAPEQLSSIPCSEQLRKAMPDAKDHWFPRHSTPSPQRDEAFACPELRAPFWGEHSLHSVYSALCGKKYLAMKDLHVADEPRSNQN